MDDFEFDVIASAMIMDELINPTRNSVKQVIYNDGLHLSAQEALQVAFNTSVKTMRACRGKKSNLYIKPALLLSAFIPPTCHVTQAHQQQIRRLLTLPWRGGGVGIRERLV